MAADQAAGNQYTTFFGAVRPFTSSVAGLGNIVSHQAAGQTSFVVLKRETVGNILAHETGHTLGLHHTHSNNPPAATTPPGCFGFANAKPNSSSPPNTDWPWTNVLDQPFGNNRIQSTKGLEVGFDVAAQMALDPNFTYELMSYCLPMWISPLRFSGHDDHPRRRPGSDSFIHRTYAGGAQCPASASHHLHGTILDGDGVHSKQRSGAQIDPLFQYTLQGDTSGGSGGYSLQVQGAGGNVLFTQKFALWQRAAGGR